jgi:Secretion system C-terminal sorting domain/Concanavalin A-like lectin/glucanases superfamily
MKAKLLCFLCLGTWATLAHAQMRPTDGLQFYYPLWSLASPAATTTTTPTFAIPGAPAALFPWRQEPAFVANNNASLGTGLLAKAQDRFLDFTPPNDNNALQFINTSTADGQADQGRDNFVLLRQNDIRNSGTPVGYSFPESGTLAIWVYRDSWEKGTNKTYTETIINNGVAFTNVDNPYAVQLGFAHSIGSTNTPGLVFYFGGEVFSNRVLAAVPRTPTNLPNNSWNHIAVTWQQNGGNTTIKIYLNGELAVNLADGLDPTLPPLVPAEITTSLGFATLLPAYPSGSGSFFWEWGIGRALSDPTNVANIARDHYPFNGRMAEMRVFRRAINACEADYLFKEGRVTVWTGRKDSNWNDPENWTATTSPTPPAFPTLATRDGSAWGLEIGRFRTGGVPGPNQTVIIPYRVALNSVGIPTTDIPHFPTLPSGVTNTYTISFGNQFTQSSPNLLLLGADLTRSNLTVADGATLNLGGVVTAVAPGTASFLTLTDRASFVQGPCGDLQPESTNPLITTALLEGARGTFTKTTAVNSTNSVHLVHPNTFFGYNYWASPVRNAVANTVFPNPYRLPNNAPSDAKAIFKYQYVNNLGAYNQYNGLWQFVGNAEVMEPARGYAVAGADQAIFGGLGTFHNAGQGFPIRYTVSRGSSASTPGWDGFNLIGNPFPSPISLERFLRFDDNSNGVPIDNLSKLVANTGVYFWQDDGANFSNRVDNGNTNDYTVCTLAGCDVSQQSAQFVIGQGGVDDGFANSGNTYIPAAQGFFINVNANSDIFFTNDMRVFAGGADIPNRRFFRPESAEQPSHLRLTLTGPQEDHNSTFITFRNNYTEELDHGYDGLKMEGSPRIAFYSLHNGQTALGIQALPSLDDTREVDLGFRAGVAGQYSIEPTDLKINPGIEVLLYDSQTETYHNLRLGAYKFTSQVGRQSDRFVVVFRPFAFGSGRPESPAPDAQPKYYPNPLTTGQLQLRLTGSAQGDVNVRVVDLWGHEVARQQFKKAGLMLRNSLQLNHLKSGIYLVETELNGQKTVTRFLKQ